MKIPSKSVIQADSPERVKKTIESVGRGAKTDATIAANIGGLTSRQGRYYRLAAEQMGFLDKESPNSSTLSALGRRYIESSEAVRNDLFLQSVLGDPLLQRLIPFLESKGSKGASREDLRDFIGRVAALGSKSTLTRRVSSYVQWLRKLNLADLDNRMLVMKTLPDSIPVVAFEDNAEPIFPRRYDLKEYDDQAKRAAALSKLIDYHVDQVVRERALNSHSDLIRLVADHLRKKGAVPRSNRYIDLSARLGGSDFLFEMKSTTAENSHSQIRKGLSQLYEYRYIQDILSPKLVLVVEHQLPSELNWMEDYLLNDRGVFLVWNGDGQLHSSAKVKDQLPFLS